MKTLAITLMYTLFLSSLGAQNEGIINYTETFKLDIHFEGMDESMKSMIPQSQSLQKQLLFKDKQSLFRNKKGESVDDLELSSDDGSFEIKIMVDDEVEDILYKNFTSKQKIHQRGLMGKPFLVTDALQNYKWKLVNEKIKYMDYECQKAVLETDEDFVIAWFTPQIPATIGPDVYHGLPGAILMLSINDGQTEYKATGIEFNAVNKDEFKAPKDGKEVNEEEFEKIRIEKEKEMEEMYGGRVRKIIEN